MSRIEQLISDMEAYIDDCKFQKFSSTKIIVDKEKLEDMLTELRMRTPDEIKKYQKIINSKEAIINEANEQADMMRKEAKAQADAILNQAQKHTAELISEHEVMQQAYDQANNLIDQSNAQAQMIVGRAEQNAYEIRTGAIEYTDEMLSRLQYIIEHSINDNKRHYEILINDLESMLAVVTNNRNELKGGSEQERVSEVEPTENSNSTELAVNTENAENISIEEENQQ